jgi:uncharacterized membrane protein YhaH (DUF805 family)
VRSLERLGPLDRAPYAIAGLALSGVKLTIDRLVSENVFHRSWSPSVYLVPLGRGSRVDALAGADRGYVAALVALALPFVALGTWLTLRRLRSAGWSPWFVLLFFVPLVNLAFFAALCVAPPRAQQNASARDDAIRTWQRWLPSSYLGAALVAALATGLAATAFVAFATRSLADYGWGVFVALPFAQGLFAVWLVGARAGRVLGIAGAVGVAVASVAVTAGLLVAFAFEGVVCLALAAPLAVPLAAFGGLAGRAILTLPHRRAAALVAGLVSMPIAFLGAMPSPTRDAPRYAVVSSVIVDAPPERVWPHVIAFAPLAPPAELAFRMGIAYPMRAHIDGSGRGAIRYCEFSTGTFVEPITAWEPARRLAFGVARNPPPMRELSPWGAIDAPHLTHFLVADAGEFRLDPLPGGRTELVGTTWYRHHLYPAAYWRWWSDAIIHRIHLRVLEHVARLSTAAP